MTGFKQRLAERIVEAREAQGWDQRELAFRAKLADKTIQRLEQAKVDHPRGSTLRKIAEATGKEVSDLRPDMDTEERNLRAQLNRVEAMLRVLMEAQGLTPPPLEGPGPGPLLSDESAGQTSPKAAKPKAGRGRSAPRRRP